MKQFARCCFFSFPELVVSWSRGFGSLQIKQSGSGDECLPLPVCQFEFDGATHFNTSCLAHRHVKTIWHHTPFLSLQNNVCVNVRSKKKNQWKSTLNWSLLKKKKLSTIFLDNLFSILLLFTRIGFKFRNWKITALLWLLPMVEQQACWCHRVVYKQRRKYVKYQKKRK